MYKNVVGFEWEKKMSADIQCWEKGFLSQPTKKKYFWEFVKAQFK